MLAKLRRGATILRATVGDYLRDDGPFLSAGIAFYALFSLFPMAIIAISLTGYLLPAGTTAERYTLEMAHYYLPGNVVQYLQGQVWQLGQDRGKLGTFGLLALLWSGRHLFRAMELGLHRAWDIPVRRGFVTGNLISILLLMLCGVVSFGIALFSAFLSSVQALIEHWNLPALAGFSLNDALFWGAIHSWVVTPLATLLVFLLLYVLLPSQQVPLVHALPGAVFATVAFKLTGWVYLTFILTMLQLNPIYASIWSLAGLMIWLYLGAAVFLLGAELVHVLSQSEGGAVVRKPKPKRPPAAPRKARQA